MDDPAVANALYWVSWMPTLRNVAAALVAVGVVMEFAEGWISEPWRKTIEDARTAEIARLSTEAEVARASIAEANARAAEAQLALEKLKTPRTLVPARQRAVAAAIRPFAGQRYLVAISDAADDGLVFWQSLHATLESAGWVYVAPAPGQPAKGVPPAHIPIAAVPGVEILFDPAKEQELTPPALALGNALHADGMVVAVDRNSQSNPNRAEQDILIVRIGARVPSP
jgi:hypothetical protein